MSTDVKNKVNEILVAHNLDFRIEKEQLLSATGKPTPFYGLFNDKTGECINSVKEGYTVSQNDEIVELVLNGMQGFGDLSVSKAGSLNGGRKVFIQLGIEGMSIVGSERIKRYVTIIDSNDGSTGLSVGIGELVMSCQNQFFKFYKSGQSKLRHTASLTQRIKEIPYLIEMALSESLKLTETYIEMQNYTFKSNEVSRQLADEMVRYILGFDRTMSIKTESELSTRSLNAMETLYNHIEKETNQKGQNMFGLFSGVTSWTTHEKSAPRRENGREESMMTGTNYRTNEQGLEFALNKLGLVMA
jgi:hypothetical protein